MNAGRVFRFARWACIVAGLALVAAQIAHNVHRCGTVWWCGP